MRVSDEHFKEGFRPFNGMDGSDLTSALSRRVMTCNSKQGSPFRFPSKISCPVEGFTQEKLGTASNLALEGSS